MMKVFILTEGGKNRGFGHIARCSAIYDAFKEKRITPFFLVNADNSVRSLLNNRKYRLFDWLKKERELFFMIKDAEVVIIDSYTADQDFYKKISQKIPMPVYLDDNKRLNYPRGIVVNGSLRAGNLNYPKNNKVCRLLGEEYMPLRKEFWDVAKKKIRNNIRSIMITFGGDDSKNMTLKILGLVTKNYPQVSKIVIIGKGFKKLREIKQAKDERTEFVYYPGAGQMRKAMMKADVAISAGGQTLYELARIGVPTIGICVAENQKTNLEGGSKAGFLEYIGDYKDKKILRKLENALKALFISTRERKLRSVNGRRYLDGQGAKRIIEALF